MTDEIFDVIVIGAGPAGENIAQYAREGGDLHVALIERELVGGECSYYACIPSKALLRPIEVAATAADLDGIRGVQLDAMALLRRRDRWISGYDDAGQAAWVASAGLTLVRGQARLIGERRVAVVTTDGELGQERTLKARHAVVLATGSEAILPPLYAAALPWSSRDATGVVEVPRRLAIVGGGVVACEAAGWLAALGSEVILLVRDQRLLGRVESFAADLVLAAMRERGIDVRLGVEVTGCRRPEARDTGLGRIHGGTVELDVDGTTLRVDEVLVAVGRRPRLGDVGLEAVGLDDAAVRAGAVPDWLVAVGDASGEPRSHRRPGRRPRARAAPAAGPAAPGHLHRPAHRFGGYDVCGRRGSWCGGRCGQGPLGCRGWWCPRARHGAGCRADHRRPGHGLPGGRDLRGTGGSGADPRCHGGHRGSHPGRRAASCRAELSHGQRVVAANARGTTEATARPAIVPTLGPGA